MWVNHNMLYMVVFIYPSVIYTLPSSKRDLEVGGFDGSSPGSSI